MTVRTRFAPSPTGYLHVGGIRTALFAYLVAKQANGQFILRLEDTDKKREVEGSAQHLIDSLHALGIEYDEGPDIGGPFGPYRQSDRLDRYHHYAKVLIDAGRAYADPYTADEVQAFREEAQAQKQPFLYRNHRPAHPPTWDGSTPLRFKSDPRSYEWHDEVMGDLVAHPENIDDFVLIKSDGYPTYDFAHIIDDLEMKVTHVIRGQEFISSMPKYLNMYDALAIERPIFAHMPHILNERGNKKLGKRDGAKDVLDYIRDGHLPEALVAFIATMGWNDGTEKEIFTMDELRASFSLDKVQRSGARFDEKRLVWMNGHFIRELPLNELMSRVESFWPTAAGSATLEYKSSVLALAQDRLKTLRDLPGLTNYFFAEPEPDMELLTSNKQLKKLAPEEIASILSAAHDALAASDWSPNDIQDTLNNLLQSLDQKPAVLFGLIRIATTWAPFSPQLNDTLALLGKDTVLARLQRTINR